MLLRALVFGPNLVGAAFAAVIFAVLLEPRSRGGSHYIHRFLRPGGTVWVRPPRNMFPLDDAPHHLLLAAGIGITPMLAMARQLAARGEDWSLVYLVRDRQDAAFTEELAALGDRARIHVGAEQGRLDLAELVSGIAPGTRISACGPQRFIDALDDAALPAGCTLHSERFEPRKREFEPNEPFTVECTVSQTTVEVPAQRSMLAALQGAGIDASGSCLRGICGSCALQVIEGEVEHRDSLTTDDSSMIMYPCVSRARGDRLVVEA